MKQLLSCIALPRACTTVIQAQTSHSIPLRPVQVTSITQIITRETSGRTLKQDAGRIFAVSLQNFTTGVSRRVSG